MSRILWATGPQSSGPGWLDALLMSPSACVHAVNDSVAHSMGSTRRKSKQGRDGPFCPHAPSANDFEGGGDIQATAIAVDCRSLTSPPPESLQTCVFEIVCSETRLCTCWYRVTNHRSDAAVNLLISLQHGHQHRAVPESITRFPDVVSSEPE